MGGDNRHRLSIRIGRGGADSKRGLILIMFLNTNNFFQAIQQTAYYANATENVNKLILQFKKRFLKEIQVITLCFFSKSPMFGCLKYC